MTCNYLPTGCPHFIPGTVCSHTHSCYTQRNQQEPLGHSGPPQARCKCSQVPYVSLCLGGWQAARQVSGSGEYGLVPVALLGGCDPVSIVTQKISCVFASPQIRSTAGSFGSASKMNRLHKTLDGLNGFFKIYSARQLNLTRCC